MGREVVDAETLTKFLENWIKDINDAPCWGTQRAAVMGSAIGLLEKVRTFVKESSTPEFDKTIGRKMEPLQERDAALEQI